MNTKTTTQINQFLPVFLCSVSLIFFKLFCNSSLPLSVQQVCSASTCFVILLYFNLFCYSSLLQVLFIICYSSLSFISHCAYSQSHTTHSMNFPFLQFHSFFIQNDQPYTVHPIFFYTHLHDSSTSQLLRQKKDNCPSN